MAYYSESFFRDYRNNESEYILKAQINEARGSRDWTTFDISFPITSRIKM